MLVKKHAYNAKYIQNMRPQAPAEIKISTLARDPASGLVPREGPTFWIWGAEAATEALISNMVRFTRQI